MNIGAPDLRVCIQILQTAHMHVGVHIFVLILVDCQLDVKTPQLSVERVGRQQSLKVQACEVVISLCAELAQVLEHRFDPFLVFHKS